VLGRRSSRPSSRSSNNIQFDTVSLVIGWESHLRWIARPGNDLYLGYTHNWLEDPALAGFFRLNRRAASKVLYTQRF
jgi:hypothetical protein